MFVLKTGLALFLIYKLKNARNLISVIVVLEHFYYLAINFKIDIVMKNLIKALAVVVLVTTFFASCNKRKNSIDSSKLNLQSAEAEFLGDKKRENVYTYFLFLDDEKLTFNPKGDGRFVALEMNVEPSDLNEIIPGRYEENPSSRKVKLTFEKGKWETDDQGAYMKGSYIGTQVGGQFQQKPITSGNLNVAQNGNTYTISGVVVAEGQTYNIEYKGEIKFYDLVVPLPETLTHGEIWYWGDPDNDGLSIFSIRLGADDVKMTDFSGKGDAMQIEVYTPSSLGNVITDGIYPIRVNSPEKFTAIDGYYDDVDNADYGTWYYTADAMSVREGYVRVTKDPKKGSTYRLDFDMIDDWYGYTIKDYYEGQLAFRDMREDVTAVKVRSSVRSVDGTSSVTSANGALRGKTNRTQDRRELRPTERRIETNIPKAVRNK